MDRCFVPPPPQATHWFACGLAMVVQLENDTSTWVYLKLEVFPQDLPVYVRPLCAPYAPPMRPLCAPMLHTELAPGNPGCSQRW
eukprot:6589385-Pyramimonas_sp.AAC.1